MKHKSLLFFLIIAACISFNEAYFPKTLIPKRLRVKLCEKNPNLSICDTLIDSPKYSPLDRYSKWEICKFRPDILFCKYFFDIKSENFLPLSQIPLKPYESLKDNNGFIEPKIIKASLNTTKLATILTTQPPASTVGVREESEEVDGSGEDNLETTSISVVLQESTTVN